MCAPHPSALAAQDVLRAAAVAPLLLLPSRGEDKELFAEFARLSDRCTVRPFPDSEHGWIGARADWDKDRPNIDRALDLLTEFFVEHLQIKQPKL